MSWSTNRSQRATIFDIATPQGELTVVLASKDEIETMSLYYRIHTEKGKEVLHIAAAAGRAHVDYPTNAVVHACPMHHEGQMRSDGIVGFWNACQETARQGQAVAIHCNNSFHRGPLALLAVMVLAGYNKDIAMATIAERRCVYLGHTVPFLEWPRVERENTHAEDLLRCHAWIETLDLSAGRSAALAGAAVVVGVAEAGAANVPEGWRCSSCNKLDQNLRQCWECGHWDCKPCSFWCTLCPSHPRQYTICGPCNADGIHLRRCGKIWSCLWCQQG